MSNWDNELPEQVDQTLSFGANLDQLPTAAVKAA